MGVGDPEEQRPSACPLALAVAWAGSAGHLCTFQPQERVVLPLIDVTSRFFQVCFDLWQILSSFANTAYFFQLWTRVGSCLVWGDLVEES